MESEKCRYQAACSFVAAILVSLVVFVFIFGNTHWETLKCHPAYLIIKDNGSLIAGLIALFAAIYTVSQHKKQSRKEHLNQERQRVLSALCAIKNHAGLLSKNELMELSKDDVVIVCANLFENTLIAKAYFDRKKSDVESKKASLVISNIQLFERYAYLYKFSKNASTSLYSKAEEVNSLLQDIKNKNKELNSLLPSNDRFLLYEDKFSFMPAKDYIGAYTVLSGAWYVVANQIVTNLIDEILNTDDMK